MGHVHDSKCTSLTSPNLVAVISFWKRLYLIYENGHMPCGSMKHSEDSAGGNAQRVVEKILEEYVQTNTRMLTSAYKCVHVYDTETQENI